ncbi:hypothetical protein P3T76_001718 [Phytophthora citrophthora]|uniref:Uncharacterized protein n=1 Tax=Phytophthora citrophthora TaxID=4793 RepID=A0AAD9LS89_9STRA|nr:hypothetical protein P3T76_001718 [Phytophthora citrophthora]
MAEAVQQLKTQLHASLDERMREILTAQMEQVGAEIRLAIARQGQYILAQVKCQIDDFQQTTTAQIEQAKSFAEKKAKSIVRHHHAEENIAHETLKRTLLKAIEESSLAAIGIAVHRAEEAAKSCNNQLVNSSATTKTNAQTPVVDAAPTIQLTGGDGDLESGSSDEEVKPSSIHIGGGNPECESS